MSFRTVILSTLLISASFLAGCGNIKIVRPAPTVPVYSVMNDSKPNDMPLPPPAAYLQRGSTCKLLHSSYRSDTKSTLATKVDVEECWWLQRGPTGRQSECRSRSTFTTYIGKDVYTNTIPETFLEKTTNCYWNEGRGQCHLRIVEDSKLFPEVQGDVLRSYRKVHLSKPTENLRCR